MEDILYKPNYVPYDEIVKIKHFYDKIINDSFSNGPKENLNLENGMQGCWDRPLRLERSDNPIISVINNLHKEFGAFEIHEASIRYMAFPFGPHTDIRNTAWLKAYRKNYDRGYTFLIPLSWKEGYQPGTAFFSCPPDDAEPLYEECLEWLPKYSEKGKIIERNFSVKQIIKWQQPGDLVVWKNFQWHCSLSPQGYVYDSKKWVKEFISIETYYPKS